MFTLSFRDVGELLLNVAVGPANGPPLVLFHGVLRGWRDFAPLWPALLPRWQVHSVDLRGHGQSGRCPGRYRVTDHAGDGIALARQLPQGAVLFGHSLGALVATAVAAALPNRVCGIILEDPPAPSFLASVTHSATSDSAATAGSPPAPSFLASVTHSPWYAVWTAMQKLAERKGRSTAEVARDLAEVRVPTGNGSVRLGDVRDATSLRFSARCLEDLDPAVLTSLLENRWLEGYDIEEVWRKVRCPALILRGEEQRGGMLGRAEAEQMAGWMGEGWVVDVPTAGHLIHWQEPEATARLCLGFLESL
jgi:pimeloyl-ACP methyl ester carboxylesterase